MLWSVSSELILCPGLGRLGQPVQMKQYLMHHHSICRDPVFGRLVVELNQARQAARHSERIANPAGDDCQIICRIADPRALPIEQHGLAVIPVFKQQVLRKEISMQNRRSAIMKEKLGTAQMNGLAEDVIGCRVEFDASDFDLTAAVIREIFASHKSGMD